VTSSHLRMEPQMFREMLDRVVYRGQTTAITRLKADVDVEAIALLLMVFSEVLVGVVLK